ADAAYDSPRPELRDALTEYYRVDGLHDVGSLIRALGYFTHRYGKIDRIDSLNEYWLETEARLRTEFNIPGLRLQQMDRIKRKSAMKRVFERAGVPVATGRVCRSPRAVRQFVDEVGYPIIAKPDVGVGAARTYRIENDDDLTAYLADRPRTDYILEECLAGQLLSYDGHVASQAGSPWTCGIGPTTSISIECGPRSSSAEPRRSGPADRGTASGRVARPGARMSSATSRCSAASVA